ncbi:hypothetical protein KR026_008902 [Drosophila bipectinata]|nr:hypothetical protein KR026_008902 [Drosophila bipectinata]
MSSLSPCFSVGSLVRCKTCFGDNIKGEVLAFDLGIKMLILKCPASKGFGDQQRIFNRTIVNLSLCRDIEIVQEMIPKEIMLPPEPLNLHWIQERLSRAMASRAAICRSYHPKATPLAQALFRKMVQHFGEGRVNWIERRDSVAVKVMRQVVIGAPYQVENIFCTSSPTPQLLLGIRQIVQSLHHHKK